MNISLRLTLFSLAAGGIFTDQTVLPGFKLVLVGKMLRPAFLSLCGATSSDAILSLDESLLCLRDTGGSYSGVVEDSGLLGCYDAVSLGGSSCCYHVLDQAKYLRVSIQMYICSISCLNVSSFEATPALRHVQVPSRILCQVRNTDVYKFPCRSVCGRNALYMSQCVTGRAVFRYSYKLWNVWRMGWGLNGHTDSTGLNTHTHTHTEYISAKDSPAQFTAVTKITVRLLAVFRIFLLYGNVNKI